MRGSVRRGTLFLLLFGLAALAIEARHASAAPPAGSTYDGRPIARVRFKGNRKTESEAIRQNLTLLETEVTRQNFTRERLRDDVRGVWGMGYFEDVRVDVVERDDGALELIWIVSEKPSIRKIYVAGNKEVNLEKVNEVLDLRKETILDLARIKRNVEKIHDLYVEKGYYLADVDSEVRRISQNEVDVYFKVTERAKVEVRQVRFLGNQAVGDDELKKVMQTQEGGFLSFLTSSGTYREDAFDRDLLMLTAYYYDKGYINVKIGRPQQDISGDRRFLYLTIPVDEGPRYTIGTIDFRGDLVVPKDEYVKKLTVKAGDTFNRTKLGADINKLNDLYKDRGYAYVNINPLTDIDSEAKTVSVIFEAQKGQLVYFERINIRGNTKTRDKVIRRELKVSEGELYNQSMLDLSKRRVQALGFFEKVELATRRGSTDDKIEINIEVTERPTGTFQIGAGFSSVENFIGQAQVAQNNLFGRGQTLTLQAQISSIRQLFTLRFLEPYFLDTPVSFGFSIYNSLVYYPNFNRRATGGDLTFGYQVSDNTRVFGTYKLEDVAVAQNQTGQIVGGFGPSTASANTITNLFRAGLTSSIRASVSYDTRNDRLFPTKGWFLSGALEVADEYIGSATNVNFVRANGFARFYQPLFGPLVFRANVDIGFIYSRSDIGVPIYERYLLGGINTVRGYRLFTLGPRVNILASQDPNAPLTGFNIGGNLQLIGNFEIEIPIFPQVNIKGVVFFDVGNAYNTESRLCRLSGGAGLPDPQNPCLFDQQGLGGIFANLRTSVGFGFRWVSPLGPLRFEWGIPIIQRLQGEDPIVFEFTIGNFF